MPLPPIINALLKKDAHSLTETFMDKPDLPHTIELRQTHISYLIFTPKFVYKIKKPVDFGFLDFTTLEKRKFFCEQEVILNKRLCPDMYLDVVEIREKEGVIKLASVGFKQGIEGDGKIVEYAVKMKRLPSEKMMDIMMKSSAVTGEMIERIAKSTAEFHKKADTSPHIAEFGKLSLIKQNTDENFSQTLLFIGKTISRERYDRIKSYVKSFFDEHSKTFEKRIEQGFIKDCHGDMHSEDICIANGIYIFDCIEFNERFRYSDTVSDIAFLAMDLDFYNCHNLSKRFVDAYIKASKDIGVLELLNFYKCYRAYVRGKVGGFKSEQKEVPEKEREHAIIKAKRYFYLADLYASGGFRPTLLVICGLTGTGKTTLARAFAEETGFKVISSDVVRKELSGIKPTEHRYEEFEKGIYTRDFTVQTYEEMMRRGEGLLQQGISVIIDATFMAVRFREMAIKLAQNVGANLCFIECALDDATVKERLDVRMKKEGIPSDGRWEVYLKQKGQYEPPTLPSLEGGGKGKGERYFQIDTSGNVDEVKNIVLDKMFG